jgi:5-hydroxyisourate hydrolase
MMRPMAGITTHVLDTSVGRPAAGVPVLLEVLEGDGWTHVGSGSTDQDGRLAELLAAQQVDTATYQLRFDTATYFRSRGVRGFYPEITVRFEVTDAGAHHHVPLLLSPFGYSTYRGS